MIEREQYGDSRDRRDPATDSMVNWVDEPTFVFADEVDALTTIQELGDELEAARKQVRHTMQFLTEAVLAARRQQGVDAKAIIGSSGLSRRTVYLILGES